MTTPIKEQKAKPLLEESYGGSIFGQLEAASKRVMIGVPVTGLVRVEWMMGRYGQTIPCNWSQVEAFQFITNQVSPMNFLVPDARNIIVQSFIEQGFEWLFFIDHDTIPPPHCFVHWNERMLKGDVPIFCGLYFTKSLPAEPLVYRGRGNGYYNKWKMGEEVWVDGIPMGCTVIHRSILELMWNESPEYETLGRKCRQVFINPHFLYEDVETKSWFAATGTEDLEWCKRVVKEDIFKRAGWPDFAKKEFPFLIDTKVFCKHIDMNGRQYPLGGEEEKFK